MKKKSRLWKTLACLISLLLIIQTAFPSLKTFASRNDGEIIGVYYYDNWKWETSLPNVYNTVDRTPYDIEAGDGIPRTTIGDGEEYPAYCIAPGTHIRSSAMSYYPGSDYWDKIGEKRQKAVNLALYFGNQLNKTHHINWLATQIVIWEYMVGYRDLISGECKNCSLANNVSPHSAFNPVYNWIDQEVKGFRAIPYYMSRYADEAQTYTLTYDPSKGVFYHTFTDTNVSLSDMTFLPVSGDIKITKSADNKSLTISTPNTISESNPLTIEAKKSLPYPSSGADPIVWSTGRQQPVCTNGGKVDPTEGYIRIKTESVGNIKIVKQAEDGVVAGRTFCITGKNVNKTVTTGADGTIMIPSLLATPGNEQYTVEEVPNDLPKRYIYPQSQTFNLRPGQTTTVYFSNIIKKARLKYLKSDRYDGGYLSNAKYRIYRLDGTYVCELTSDANQLIYSPKIPYGDYYFQESQAPQYFALDSTKYQFSILENDVDVKLSVSDPPLSDVYPTFVQPNASYRSNTEVVASYLIHNNSIAQHTSDRSLNVHFNAYYINSSGAKVSVSTQQKNVVVPQFNENLVYFKVKIPPDAANIHYICTVDTPSGVVETNTANNTDTQNKSVSSLLDSQTPNTKFENAPDYFNKPDDSAVVPTGNYATTVTPNATWEQWAYENNAFVKKTYGLTLASNEQLTPDSNSLSRSQDQETGYWHMKSGYGVSLKATSSANQIGRDIFTDKDAYVLPQNGNAYFPEFGFELTNLKYRTLQLTSPNTLEFEQNPFSITKQGVKDGRRIHYTPLWYPNGNYTVKTYLFDCWTPAGMIGLQSTLQPIVIGGSMYDDWYVNHTN